VIFIVPILMGYGCMEEPYGIPKGSGNPVAARTKRVPPKEKPPIELALQMNSAFIFDIPKLEDSKVLEELEEATEDTYEADTNAVGQLGEGGGTEGGWPNGMENAKLRFIRLEYGGGDWDQDMGKGADYNILKAIHDRHKFKIWPNTESRPAKQLRRFPKHRAPPFVYLTGKGAMNFSSSEIETLRWYCLEEKGMIFADNGGGNFNSSFRRLMKRIFPEKPLLDISDDDPIYRQPYAFPNGAPPLWHHSGYRAMGVKDGGRWCVFYHQGDINDAWKDEGAKALSKRLRQSAFKMGINVIAYSFRHYLAHHFGAMKDEARKKKRRRK
jgi:hypothetical protein